MKKYKNIFKTLFLTSLYILVLTSCDDIRLGNSFLEQPPELNYSLDSAFVNALRAREVLWNGYSTLPYGHGFGKDEEARTLGWIAFKSGVGWTSSSAANSYEVPIWVLTDLIRYKATGNSMNRWYQGTITAQNARYDAKYVWEKRLGWAGIRISHIFIDRVDEVPDMTEAEKTRLKAEAKIIIATHYVEMFHHYGGVPYIDKAFDPNDELVAQRLTVMETVDMVCDLIDEALPDLPFDLGAETEQWSGRITGAAAMGLKVKFLLMAASPLFNSDQPYMAGEASEKHLVWTGGYKRELWEKLKTACEALLTRIEGHSYHRMVNTGNPTADYRAGYMQRTGETLFSTRAVYRWQSGRLPEIIRNAHWWYDSTPLHNYARKFPMRNGKSIDDPESGYDPNNPYYDRDPRFYETFRANGTRFQSRNNALWVGGQDRTSLRFQGSDAGYILFKWKLNSASGGVGTETFLPDNWPYFRIPDLYLIYAETLNELNNGPTDAAFDYVNRVRARVDVGPVEGFIGKARSETTKQEFLDALLNERVLELGCENARWFDMVRYKMRDVFTATDYAMDIYVKDGVEMTQAIINDLPLNQHDQYFDYVITPLPNSIKWQDPAEFSTKYYLDPLPFSEIQKGYGLIQNPGW